MNHQSKRAAGEGGQGRGGEQTRALFEMKKATNYGGPCNLFSPK